MMRDLNTVLLADLCRAPIRARANVETRCAERVDVIELVLNPQSLYSVLEDGPIEIREKEREREKKNEMKMILAKLFFVHRIGWPS
jgi:hypothetical protein